MITKTKSTGSCSFKRTSPSLNKLQDQLTSISINLTFEEALKFSLAVDEGVRRLNRLNRSTDEAKKSALKVLIHFGQERIVIIPEGA